MILGRYLEQTMERAVEFVMTSNYHPDRALSGRPAARALPARDRADQEPARRHRRRQRHDYRRLKMERLKVYHLGASGEAELGRIFSELKDVEEESQPLDVEGRQIPYRKRAGAWCGSTSRRCAKGPRSYADYVDLAKRFHTVILARCRAFRAATRTRRGASLAGRCVLRMTGSSW